MSNSLRITLESNGNFASVNSGCHYDQKASFLSSKTQLPRQMVGKYRNRLGKLEEKGDALTS